MNFNKQEVDVTVLEPSAREVILDVLAVEGTYVTVYNGVTEVHGLLTEAKESPLGGWTVITDDAQWYLPRSQADELGIVFKDDGSIYIYPEQVL